MSMAVVSVRPTTYVLMFAHARNHVTKQDHVTSILKICLMHESWWTSAEAGTKKATGTGETCQRNIWRERQKTEPTKSDRPGKKTAKYACAEFEWHRVCAAYKRSLLHAAYTTVLYILKDIHARPTMTYISLVAYVGMALTDPLALKGVTHVIVVCYHPHLVSMLFATSIPTSFNILLKMFYSCWGERERAPTLMMSMAVVSVRPTTYVLMFAHARNHVTKQDHVTSILKMSHDGASWTSADAGTKKTTGTGETCQRNTWRERQKTEPTKSDRPGKKTEKYACAKFAWHRVCAAYKRSVLHAAYTTVLYVMTLKRYSRSPHNDLHFTSIYVHNPEATVAVRSWGGEIRTRALQ